MVYVELICKLLHVNCVQFKSMFFCEFAAAAQVPGIPTGLLVFLGTGARASSSMMPPWYNPPTDNGAGDVQLL
jgi:hypothetical protein